MLYNINFFKKKGALTEKTYNFTYRSWELLKNNVIDFSDGSNLKAQIFIKNNEIIRILPTSNNFLNDEWLSDKSKYLYDQSNLNRIQANCIKYNKICVKQFLKVSDLYDNKFFFTIIKNLISSFNEKLIQNKYKNSSLFNFSDENETTLFLYYKTFFNLKYYKNYNIKYSNFYVLKNIDAMYTKTNISFCMYLVPKIESWILNVKLLKSNRKIQHIVLGINNNIDFNFVYKNIGLNFTDLLNFLFNKLIINKRNILYLRQFLFGKQVYQIISEKNLFKIINKLTFILNKNNIVLSSYIIASTFNFYTLIQENLNLNSNNIKKNKLIFNSNLDNINFNNNKFNIYINYMSFNLQKNTNINNDINIYLKKNIFIEKNYK